MLAFASLNLLNINTDQTFQLYSIQVNSFDSKCFHPSYHKGIDTAHLAWFREDESISTLFSGLFTKRKTLNFAWTLSNKLFVTTTKFIDRWKNWYGIAMKKVLHDTDSAGEGGTRHWWEIHNFTLLIN